MVLHHLLVLLRQPLLETLVRNVLLVLLHLPLLLVLFLFGSVRVRIVNVLISTSGVMNLTLILKVHPLPEILHHRLVHGRLIIRGSDSLDVHVRNIIRDDRPVVLYMHVRVGLVVGLDEDVVPKVHVDTELMRFVRMTKTRIDELLGSVFVVLVSLVVMLVLIGLLLLLLLKLMILGLLLELGRHVRIDQRPFGRQAEMADLLLRPWHVHQRRRHRRRCRIFEQGHPSLSTEITILRLPANVDVYPVHPLYSPRRVHGGPDQPFQTRNRRVIRVILLLVMVMMMILALFRLVVLLV